MSQTEGNVSKRRLAASQREAAKKARSDRQKAKVVLKEIRDHHDAIEKEKDEMLDCRSSALESHFKKAAENVEKVRTVDQAHVDAQLFRKLGEYSRRQAAQLQTGLKDYDVKSFTNALVIAAAKTTGQNVEDEDEEDDEKVEFSFHKIGSRVYEVWRTVPMINFLYGNMHTTSETPAAKVRRRKERVTKGTETVKPAELERGEVEQTETDKQVTHMRQWLKRKGSVNFWDLVVDPTPSTGFTRTIENVFHSAFLIKDMYAQLDLNVDPPIITYTDPNAIASRVANGMATAENNQFVMGIDHSTYTDVISKYNITEALLPPMKRRSANGSQPVN